MKSNKGFTLLELLLTFVLGLIVIGGALILYMTTIRNSTDNIRTSRLNYDMDAAMQMMINDIRRAGYWGYDASTDFGAVAGSDAQNNPFNSATTMVTIPNSSCILYTYDGGNGTHTNAASATVSNLGTGQIESDEYFGFKLENNAIWMRLSGTPTSVGCSDSNDTWRRITDENNITISALTFSDAGSQCRNVTTNTDYASPCAPVITAGNLTAGQQAIEIREVQITMTGNVSADASMTKTLQETVKIRNDRIFTQP